MTPTCAWCGGTDTDCEFVDIGVGYQQVTAATCSCGAQQFMPDDFTCAEASDEEKRRGWWAPLED